MQPGVFHEPVTVYLLDHGRHSSLVLPRDEGIARYAYGEWQWYARDRRGALAGMAAMLWPTRGALGRKVFPGVRIPPFPSHVAPEGIEEVLILQVERSLVRRLLRHLDMYFEEGREELIHHSLYDLDFVPYPERYWFGNQSNQVTAGWLRQLGVKVSGVVWLSDWRIDAPPLPSGGENRELPGAGRSRD